MLKTKTVSIICLKLAIDLNIDKFEKKMKKIQSALDIKNRLGVVFSSSLYFIRLIDKTNFEFKMKKFVINNK